MHRPLFGAFLLASIAPVTALAQPADPARGIVQELDDGLVRIMKAGGSASSRGTAIGPVLDKTFDLPLMTRLAVGPNWTSLASSDQQGLVAAFRRMTVAQYARNFDSFSGESFTIDPQVQQRGSDKLVRTSLNAPRQAPVAISYRLRQSGGSWKIIDVFYRNSVSQIATRRSDFAGVLQKGGAKSLIAHMDAIAAKGD